MSPTGGSRRRFMPLVFGLLLLAAGNAAATSSPAPLVEAPEDPAAAAMAPEQPVLEEANPHRESPPARPPSYWERGASPLPTSPARRDAQLEHLEFLLLQSLHLSYVGGALDASLRTPGVLAVLGLSLGVGIGLSQFTESPPAIYPYAINSGTLWGAWLMLPLAIQTGSPLVAAAGSVVGAISFGLWAHAGGLREGQLAMITSAGLWAAVGSAFWGTYLLQQTGLSNPTLNLALATGASLVAGGITAWAARHVRLGRGQVLWADIAGLVGLLGASALWSITHEQPDGRLRMTASSAAMYATLPLTFATLTGVLLHLTEEGQRRESPLQVQLAPLLSDRQQGVALMASF